MEEGLDRAALSADEHADLAIIEDQIELSLLELDVIQAYKHNPTFYDPTPVTYDSPEYYVMDLESLTISSGGTLDVIGVNPMEPLG